MIRLVLRIMLACALMAPASVAPADFRASIARMPLDQGEPFDLVLSLIGGDSLEPPNVAPLSKDFEILDRGKFGRTQTVNGRSVEVTDWVLTLTARRPGRLTIPPITLGSETTAPIELTVAAGAPMEPPDDGPLSLAVEVLARPPFFQQSEIPVVVRMFDRVGALEATAGAPDAEGATFSSEGNPRGFSRVFGRQRYRVVELRYIMRPLRSGNIVITPVALKASIPTSPPGAQEQARALGRPAMPWLGGGFNAPRNVTVFSDPVELKVLPRPAEVKGWFLPAQSVKLTESWSKPVAQATVGGALTRTIRLEVRGAGPGQLPPITVPEVEGVRQYADEGRPESLVLEGGMGAALEVRVTVVPTRAGSVTLPAVELPWWNTGASRPETATLRPVTLTVAPGAEGDVAPAPAPTAARADAASPPPDATVPAGEPASEGLPWRLLLAGGAAIVLLALVAFALMRQRDAAAVKPAVPAPAPAVRRPALRRPATGPSPAAAEAAARALDAACNAGDAAAAHRALLDWCRASGRGAGHRRAGADPTGADAFRTAGMATAALDLRQHLYAGDGARWNGRALAKAFAGERRALRKPAGKAARQLQPLYPAGR